MDQTVYWRGIWKVIEEYGELGRILGKIGAFPVGPHPSGENLLEELNNELTDLEAAICYFRTVNNLQCNAVRFSQKYSLFCEWKLTGVLPEPVDQKE